MWIFSRTGICVCVHEQRARRASANLMISVLSTRAFPCTPCLHCSQQQKGSEHSLLNISLFTMTVVLTKAKQELKPILAFVVGALISLLALVFFDGLSATSIHLFEEVSEDNSWKHALFLFAGCSIQFRALGLFFGSFSDDDDDMDYITALWALSLVFSLLSISVSPLISFLHIHLFSIYSVSIKFFLTIVTRMN